LILGFQSREWVSHPSDFDIPEDLIALNPFQSRERVSKPSDPTP